MSTAASNQPDAHQLLEESAWAKSLAGRLVRDEATADDVAQDVWLATQKDAARDIQHRGAWISRVVRNLAFRSHRRDANRKAREERVARPELVVDQTAEVIEKAEVHKRLVDEVLGLDEPYRSTVLLRYFEDLSTAAIAERKGLPHATVRTHLARGIARLRSRLAAQDRKWKGSVAALAGIRLVPGESAAVGTGTVAAASTSAGSTSTVAATLSTAGGLIMSQNLVTVGAIGVVAAAVGLGLGRMSATAGPSGRGARARILLHEPSSIAPRRRSPSSDAKSANSAMPRREEALVSTNLRRRLPP